MDNDYIIKRAIEKEYQLIKDNYEGKIKKLIDEQNEKYEQLKQELEKEQNEKNKIQAECEQLKDNNAQLMNELDIIKKSKLYKLIRKVNKQIL